MDTNKKEPIFGASDKPFCPDCRMPMIETETEYVCNKDGGGCGLIIKHPKK